LISDRCNPEWPSCPTHFSIQWVLESLSPEVKQPQHEAECLPSN
jgi:hypothetical protein